MRLRRFRVIVMILPVMNMCTWYQVLCIVFCSPIFISINLCLGQEMMWDRQRMEEGKGERRKEEEELEKLIEKKSIKDIQTELVLYSYFKWLRMVSWFFILLEMFFGEWISLAKMDLIGLDWNDLIWYDITWFLSFLCSGMVENRFMFYRVLGQLVELSIR